MPSVSAQVVVPVLTPPTQTQIDIYDNETIKFPGLCSDVAVPGDPPCFVDADLAEIANAQQNSANCDMSTDPPTCRAVGSSVTHVYSIDYKPAPDHQIPDFNREAAWVANTDPKLTPDAIIKDTLHFTVADFPQYESDGGQTCYYDSQGNQAFSHVSKTKYYIPEAWINFLTQYGKRFASYYALTKVPVQNYRQPTEIIQKTGYRPCGFEVPGIVSKIDPIQTSGIVIFDVFRFLVNVVSNAIGSVTQSFAIIENSRRTPKSEQFAGFGPGVIATDLTNSPLTAAEKTYHTENPGFIETFKMPDYRPPLVDSEIVDAPYIGAFTQNTIYQFLKRLTQDGYEYLCASIWPASIQDPAYCTFVPPATTAQVNQGAGVVAEIVPTTQ